jgi:leader peptidase (prepilin peptidase)/N-methyltransferase
MTNLILFLNTQPYLTATVIGIFGLIIGSFLTVVISRYPKMLKNEWSSECREFLDLPAEKEAQTLSLALPRSHCPQCKAAIQWYENIPIISYLFLRGKCAQCKKRISCLYPLIEALTAILSTIIFCTFGLEWKMVAALFLTYVLISLFFIDLKHQLLPDVITLSVLWIGLALNSFNWFAPLQQAVWGAILGYGILWAFSSIFKYVRKKQGMGHGDFKMLAMLGAWFGTAMILNIILCSIILGTVISLLLLSFKKISKENTFPFGPFIAIAGFVSMLWGPFLIKIIMGS